MFRSWQSRWPRIAAELKQYDADILCLQEVSWVLHFAVPFGLNKHFAMFRRSIAAPCFD